MANYGFSGSSLDEKHKLRLKLKRANTSKSIMQEKIGNPNYMGVGMQEHLQELIDKIEAEIDSLRSQLGHKKKIIKPLKKPARKTKTVKPIIKSSRLDLIDENIKKEKKLAGKRSKSK